MQLVQWIPDSRSLGLDEMKLQIVILVPHVCQQRDLEFTTQHCRRLDALPHAAPQLVEPGDQNRTDIARQKRAFNFASQPPAGVARLDQVLLLQVA